MFLIGPIVEPEEGRDRGEPVEVVEAEVSLRRAEEATSIYHQMELIRLVLMVTLIAKMLGLAVVAEQVKVLMTNPVNGS